MKHSKHKISEGVLFTDFYQLSMAQLYFKQGIYDKEARFDYFFRSYPDYNSHQAGYCVFAGLGWLLDWMENARFGEKELKYLRDYKSPGGKSFFDEDFLNYLKDSDIFSDLTLRSVPEGRVVHPGAPLVVVEGPLGPAQILESALLNYLNYQTLIATKASRIAEAGTGGLVLEFGMRRAQGKGANAGARAALIGGAGFSSNTGISLELGYPPKGTHAHSMVQAFMAMGGSELDAFRAYANLYPESCLLLVDTVSTLESGVPNAVKVFNELKSKGYKPLGIRLDSGDLADLAIKSAKILNQAGFNEVGIVLSNKLDEMVIWQIITQIRQDARNHGLDPEKLISRLVYGVGTRLITSAGRGALDGVYKLAALKKEGKWSPAIKLSETPEKIINPGNKNLWRIYDEKDKATADFITLSSEDPVKRNNLKLRHPIEKTKIRELKKSKISKIENLHVSVIEKGKVVFKEEDIEQMRSRRKNDLQRLHTGVKRITNPHIYHVSLSEKLWDLKQRLIKEGIKRHENSKKG
ncbi:MAG: nicotinate phosphoribosyltransferase [Elusimicrobiota bacterium]